MENFDIKNNCLIRSTLVDGEFHLPSSSSQSSEISENDLNISRSNSQCIPESAIIKPIHRDTIHKICSGQVVLNLAIAVKELVENAIDAGATNIEIKLKDYGSESIEIIDNGCGVLEQNFASLTLKHYTSKLKEFIDLESVETLGFRGEALSSLCALSNVTITTRHITANLATKIEYDHNGSIIKQSSLSRSEGTTVTLSNIFSSLPVRRKAFLKNLKREFNKMCQLLYAYCLVSTNIKITCTNQANKNSKTVVMATQSVSTVRENIISIFGPKQISSLIDISVVQPNESILDEYNLKMTPNEDPIFSFECFMSSVVHGMGRSTTDRQFYYINSRPCEPTKVIKLVNEIYRQFNVNQYPFVYLNILIERNHVDVNVTPDKRQIFVENEKLLLAVLKASLLDAFKQFPSTYTMQNLNITKQSEVQTTLNQTLNGLKRVIKEDETTLSENNLFQCFKKKMKKDEGVKQELIKSQEEKLETKKTSGKVEQKTNQTPLDNTLVNKYDDEGASSNLGCKYTKNNECEMIVNENETLPEINDKLQDKTVMKSNSSSKTDSEILIQAINKTITKEKKDVKNTSPNKYGRVVILNTSFAAIEESLKEKLSNISEQCQKSISVKFRSQITPDSNNQAEQELQKQLTKDKFSKMEIIGQFNLGFIIVKLENDLFIVDQHATDEKYNFENLQANTVLETQVLVNPKPLQLTAANESLLIENEEIFTKNGFHFLIDHSAEATKKVQLTAIPVSKNYSFGKDDIDELLFMLQDGNNSMCRPSRVRRMFASRACRKSVMIGKPLTESDMRKLIDHMGEIDQPWVDTFAFEYKTFKFATYNTD